MGAPYTPDQIRKIAAVAQQPAPLPYGTLARLAAELGTTRESLAVRVAYFRAGKIPATWARVLALPVPERKLPGHLRDLTEAQRRDYLILRKYRYTVDEALRLCREARGVAP
jgi:hypothetical protein